MEIYKTRIRDTTIVHFVNKKITIETYLFIFAIAKMTYDKHSQFVLNFNWML